MEKAPQTGPLVCERRFSSLSLAPANAGSQRPSALPFSTNTGRAQVIGRYPRAVWVGD